IVSLLFRSIPYYSLSCIKEKPVYQRFIVSIPAILYIKCGQEDFIAKLAKPLVPQHLSNIQFS
ncbi:hypothetical protein, partial [Lactiplantibacillus plantarum]|uniref:hypothetical protein n=1 Tax=Lactiplantibacillus plantarum TaxID=1590 RepID=UPI0032DE7B99